MAKRKDPPPLKRGGRYYLDWEPASPFPGVTTILGDTVNKPALVGWAAKQAAEAALRDPSLSVEEAAARRFKTTGDAADRGSLLHAFYETIATGVPLDVELLPENARGAALSFLDWFDTMKPRLLFREVIVVNPTYGYAGSADGVILDLANRVGIIDYKTGKGVYDDMDVQVTAYKRGEYLVDPKTRERIDFDMGEVEYGQIVHLKPNGTWAVKTVEDRWTSFLAYLHLFREGRGEKCPDACWCHGIGTKEG